MRFAEAPSRLVVALLAACVLLPSSSSIASRGGVEAGGVRFGERVAIRPDVELALRGAGVLRHRGILRAYAAALYLPPDTPAGDALADVPRRLEIEYFWPIRAEEFARAAERLLEERLSPESVSALRGRLDTLHARYEDVAPGDRYALDYVPGRGTELLKNGRSLAVIPGADFASAYFGLWLGESPLDRRLRDALRGETDSARPATE